MKLVNGLLFYEGITDFNINRWMDLHINTYSPEDAILLCCEAPGEDPSQIDIERLYDKRESIPKELPLELHINKLMRRCNAQKAYVFKEAESGDYNGLVKIILRLQLHIHDLNAWHEERFISELDEYLELLREFEGGTTIDNWQAFEKSCFLLSKASEEYNIRQIKQLSVYEFFSLDKNVREFIESQTKNYGSKDVQITD